MELIIENNGFDLIGIKIFNFLPFEEILKCLFISKPWTNFILQNKKRLNLTIVNSRILDVLKNLYYCKCLKCEGCSGLDQKICNSIDELLMKAVINGWPTLLQFLLPFAQEEGIDFNAPLPTIDQEPFNKRPLLHNLVCTPHCDLDIMKILLFEVQVDVNIKDLNWLFPASQTIMNMTNLMTHQCMRYI